METIAPLITVELEGNGNGATAPGLTRSLPNGPEQRDPPPSNLTPRQTQADYPFPCSEISNTAGRLHDKIRPEGCILHTSNS